MLYSLFERYRVYADIIYLTIVVISALYAFIKTRKLYELSLHKGIRHFSTAFLFFTLGFVSWFAYRLVVFFEFGPAWLSIVSKLAFGYCITMAGFSLAYSLVQKHLPGTDEDMRLMLLHGLAAAIAVLDLFNTHDYFMYITQLSVIGYAITMSYSNYRESTAKRKEIPQLFLMGLVLAFLGFFGNFAGNFILLFYPPFITYIYASTAAIFMLFAYTIAKST